MPFPPPPKKSRKSLRPHNYSFIEIFGSVREAGYYYAEFQLGTPPQNFEVCISIHMRMRYCDSIFIFFAVVTCYLLSPLYYS